jgi:hypothetical protein
MRSSLTLVLALAAAMSLAACSGSEKAPADPTAASTTEPATDTTATSQPAAPAVRQAPSFEALPVDPSTQPSPATPTPAAVQDDQQRTSFRVPADAIGGDQMEATTFNVATRGEMALRKHFTDAGIDPSTFYFKIPVDQRGNYWTMTFYGNPPTQPDGMYVEVRVYADGSAEVMR